MENSGEKSSRSQKEEEVLKFWQKQSIFEKTLEKDAPKGDCIFYDGPPFATGLPHYGHILGGTGKDAIARYKTMQGFRVPRKWGWDTHGLPIETIVEKSLGIKSKREIEEMGLEKFATEARSKVLGFVAEWKKTVERTGRWVDFDGSYKTMDATFIESVWWALGELWKKDLVYEADRVLPYCPRCQTPLANAEIAMDNSYLDITDISVYVKFKIKNKENTYFLAWTTTPWTLPGNTALAVNPNFTYATVSFEGSHIIMLKEKVAQVFKDKQYEIIGEQAGNDLVGLEYEQLFPSKETLSEKAFHVYGADFVTADTGTGIVHIAPAFGEDDMRLARENSIPTIKHVGRDGTFQTGIAELDGHAVKPKEDHQSGDVLIIKQLAPTGNLFAKEKIIHSYPHCYRCGTPILYYALSSWFIRVQGEKETLEKLNAGIHWVPEHLRDGRFLHTIKNAPDWNISRNRYWASPLPIWKSADGKMKFIASYDELKKYSRGAVTKIIFVRHGQADHNVLGISSGARDLHPLTSKGIVQAEEAAQKLAGESVDVVFCSPILRARQTAEPYLKKTGKEMIIDDRIGEIRSGSWEEQLPTDPVVGPARAAYKTLPIEERYKTKRGGTGESWADVDIRVQGFLDEVLEKYAGKTILVFAHQGTNESAIKLLRGISNEEAAGKLFHAIGNGSIFPVYVDTKRKCEFDPHRPYIDTITLVDEEGKEYKRIPEVIDCWFESGSMPFAQDHYPFERADWQEKNFPADFVVEYIAQTRTWFYYTLLVSSLLFKKAPFQNVITTGNLNGDDGKKMSKSLGNFPDPHILIDKYGADALRLYLMSSVLMQGEDTDFDEDAVSEASKKIIARLENCLSFLELYPGDRSVWEEGMQPKGVLDQWIMVRLFEVVETMTAAMDQYHIVDALRPIDLFVDDLSTWYVRRSRERFKGDDALDKTEAQRTLTTVLKTLAQMLAPFTPFFAEHMYQKLRTENDPESVHLSVWPQQKKSFFESIIAKFSRPQPSGILQNMQQTRDIISQALEARAKAGIKVRQPLASLEFSGPDLEGEYLELIKDEVNVKKVAHIVVLSPEAPAVILNQGIQVFLDTTMTPELEIEGRRRDLIRQIQDLRKENNLNPGDVVDLVIPQDLQSVFESDSLEVKRVTSVREVSFGDGFDIKKI